MADFVNMPMLGQTMEEGTIVRWFKNESDPVKRGEALLEVMSDKANFEVEAETDGVLRKILTPADGTAVVNTPIAIIGTADEPIDSLLAGAEPAGNGASKTVSESVLPSSQAVTGRSAVEAPSAGKVFISPRARRLADERGVAIGALVGSGSGPEGRVLEKDVVAFLEAQPVRSIAQPESSRPRVTPLAAKIADDLGVEVEELATGLPGSRITADVVRRHTPAAKQPSPQPKGEPAVAEVIPMRGLRKLIADNVAKSRQTAPHVTLTLEVDMTEAAGLFEKLRPEIQKTYDTKLTYTDLLVRAAARALADHPLCNAALIGDEIRVYADKNVGVAVATEQGLIVPVIKRADSKALGEISIELKALAERCRTGKQTQDDLAGGTFSITNLGAFGIDAFDPIIVPPQSCILGVGRIADKAIVIEKQPAIRAMMNLCLSFDHRVLDGVPAARFLQRMKELLESPLLIFV